MSHAKGLTGIKSLLIILGVAVIYIVVARIGLFFALPPGFATPIWPPSGVAVAALLLLGLYVWPGIFLGAFITNIWISWEANSIDASLFISACIGIGSTLQPLAIVYILNRMVNLIHFLNTRRNILIFIFSTIFCCVIASSVGVTAIYLTGTIGISNYIPNWITWWLGDMTGILIYTPLILAWSKEPTSLTKRGFEAFQLVLITLCIGVLCFGGFFSKGYPFVYMFIPCLIWAVFRFGEKGGTALLLLISTIAVFGTTYLGLFSENMLNESLLLLQTFIGIITTTTLVLISVQNEGDHTFKVLEEHSRDLEHEVESRTILLQQSTLQLQDKTMILQDRTLELQKKTNELQEKNMMMEKHLQEYQLMHKRALSQESMASLGMLSSGIGCELKKLITGIMGQCKIIQSLIEEMMEMARAEPSMNDDEFAGNISQLHQRIQKIYVDAMNGDQILERMLNHATRDLDDYELVDFNQLIKELVLFIISNRQHLDGSFNVELNTAFDLSIDKVKIIPNYLIRALTIIVNNALNSIARKKKEANAGFSPSLEIRTFNLGDRVGIAIHDNGGGIPEDIRSNLFIPFFAAKQYEESGLGLAITYDLIVQNHGGEIKVDSVEGEFAEFTIILPISV